MELNSKSMDGGCWEPDFSLLKWKVRNKQRGKIRLIHVALEQNAPYGTELDTCVHV